MGDNMRLHFDFEQQRFCEVPSYNCVDHLMKHYKFWVILEDQKAPVGCEEINWAKNWPAQHIKNTDHQYKKRLLGPDTGDNFTGALMMMNDDDDNDDDDDGDDDDDDDDDE